MTVAAYNYNQLIDVKHIYNHDIMNCTAEGVAGNHLFSGRALGITEPWDMIQLHELLKPLWNDIVAHYERVGLSHSFDVLWNLNLKHLGSHIGYHPSVFYYGPDECQYWGDFGWLGIVEFINSKNNFMSVANQVGIDVPLTLCFKSTSDISLEDIQDITYPCYLKAAVSVSGVGIYRCESKAELLVNLGNFYKSTPVQIQEEIITDTFLNLQYKVIGDRAVRLTASEQILDGFVHQGNKVPASHEPWAAVDPMADWLVEHGMKGIFAFDVAVVKTERGLRFPAIECNPRFNGASYPTLIANKLGIEEWTALSFNTKHHDLASINLKDIEFDVSTGEGVIIVNWGTVIEGKLVILMAGSCKCQEELALELKARL